MQCGDQKVEPVTASVAANVCRNFWSVVEKRESQISRNPMGLVENELNIIFINPNPTAIIWGKSTQTLLKLKIFTLKLVLTCKIHSGDQDRGIYHQQFGKIIQKKRVSPLFLSLKTPAQLWWLLTSLLRGGGLIISPQILAHAHHRSSVIISQEKTLLPGNVWFIFFIFACCPRCALLRPLPICTIHPQL